MMVEVVFLAVQQNLFEKSVAVLGQGLALVLV